MQKLLEEAGIEGYSRQKITRIKTDFAKGKPVEQRLSREEVSVLLACLLAGESEEARKAARMFNEITLGLDLASPNTLMPAEEDTPPPPPPVPASPTADSLLSGGSTPGKSRAKWDSLPDAAHGLSSIDDLLSVPSTVPGSYDRKKMESDDAGITPINV